MKILTEQNELEEILYKAKNRDISIVSAFASGTEDLMRHLVENNKTVELIIGTINAFSSINFIKYCVELAKNNTNFTFFVDFRYHESTHWKLYTFSQNIVIIGSANLTNKGISLDRDTCLYVNDNEIYQNYLLEIKQLKNEALVISSKSDEFIKKLEEYKVVHRKAMASINKVTQTSSLKEWIKSENYYDLPLLLWDKYLPKEELLFIEEKIKELKQELAENHSGFDCNYFLIDAEDAKKYSQGDILLTMKEENPEKGDISFFKIDLCIEGKTNDTCFIIDFSSEENKGPFKLDNNSIKILKKSITKWDVDTKKSLSREDLDFS